MKIAYIQERKSKEGKTHYRVQIQLRGYPPTTATFERKTDAKIWAQQTEAAMREGRHFKSAEAKKHTVAEFNCYLSFFLTRFFFHWHNRLRLGLDLVR